MAPAWSPNGNKLAFEAYRDGQAEVYVINATGSAVTRLTNNSAYDGTPAWSPDGSKIAFTSKRTGSYQVWLMKDVYKRQPYNLAAWQAMRWAVRHGRPALFFTWQNLNRRYPCLLYTSRCV